MAERKISEAGPSKTSVPAATFRGCHLSQPLGTIADPSQPSIIPPESGSYHLRCLL